MARIAIVLVCVALLKMIVFLSAETPVPFVEDPAHPTDADGKAVTPAEFVSRYCGMKGYRKAHNYDTCRAVTKALCASVYPAQNTATAASTQVPLEEQKDQL
jgi:hypothetical protein